MYTIPRIPRLLVRALMSLHLLGRRGGEDDMENGTFFFDAFRPNSTPVFLNKAFND